MKQSVEWIKCIRPKRQMEILKPYVNDVAMNLQGRDLLQQWRAQILFLQFQKQPKQ